MGFRFAALLTSLVIATPAASEVVPHGFPAVETGEPFTVAFHYDSGSSCYTYQGVDTFQDGMMIIVKVTTHVDLGGTGVCPGPSEMFDFDLEFSVNYPGLWTMRVVELFVRDGMPDLPDVTEDWEFTATGLVDGESVSFGAIKALYR